MAVDCNIVPTVVESKVGVPPMIHCRRTSERRVKAPTPHKPPLSSCISSFFCHSNLILFKSRHWHLLLAFSCEAHQHCVGGLRAKLLSPTEATEDAIGQLYQTSDTAQNGRAHPSRSDVRQQHIVTHIREEKRQVHSGPSGERNSHLSALLVSPRGLLLLTQ